MIRIAEAPVGVCWDEAGKQALTLHPENLKQARGLRLRPRGGATCRIRRKGNFEQTEPERTRPQKEKVLARPYSLEFGLTLKTLNSTGLNPKP